MNLRHLGIDSKKYVRFILLPSVVAALVTYLFVLVYVPKLNLGLFSILFYTIPIFILLPGVLYPKIIEVRFKNDIENNIHFYITHLGVLSISEIDRKEMMKILSERKEYKSLAEETRKIYLLMAKWKTSLAQACRFIAKRTPSKIFADFLDRMAHEIDSGEDFKVFIKREQKVVMDDFATLYTGKLYSVDMFKEIYVSIILSLSFFAAFGIIMPFLTGLNVMLIMYLIIIFFFITEIGVITYLKAVAPQDPLWQTSGEYTDVDRKLYRLFALSMVIFLAVFTALLFANYVYHLIDLPFSFLMAISLTPLLIPGFVAKKEEGMIKDKDKNAPSFIMSLGASASARGGNILESLKYLTAHDFGALTEDIRALYKRLKTRINKRRAWEKFAISTNSNLIYRFTDMFVEALNLGTDPIDAAEIISENFIAINNLRARRAQSASSFVGIAYGVIIGIAFALYISFGVVEAMNNLYSSLQIAGEVVGSILHTVPAEDLSVLSNLITLLLIAHAVMATFAIKIMDGGRFMAGLIHTVGMSWVAALSGYVSQMAIKSLLGMGGI
ncbi:Type II secretion system F domain protein [Ferroglobus placidus DSM 10642]|uniref:Type II secretion system F domain protein n=1 Tax=Ferroglobus placidus (strain DSM 10642 / AEDII12DO) TaxID=589924 RepID=D3RYQ1_FERPA|nr:archaellar assembly protein FlaJ [Ferroglobus placidus]ADC65614.1 Type II secretion system F domain protein [Ferroglobus placidus DSM 10642]